MVDDAVIGFPHSIVVLDAEQRTGVDGMPVEQRDWANARETAYSGVLVQPLSSREAMATNAREVTSQWLLVSRPGLDLDIVVGNRVAWDGDVYDVVAKPEKWPALGGGVHHVEVVLQSAPPVPGAGSDTTEGHLAAGARAAAVRWTP